MIELECLIKQKVLGYSALVFLIGGMLFLFLDNLCEFELIVKLLS